MFRYKIFFNNVASNCLTGIAVAGSSMLQTLYGMTMLQNGSTFDLIFLALLGLVFCSCYITFCKQKLMGYDKQQRQFILCQWQHFGWHVLQSYPCSQFSHVAAEHIYQHGKAQFGRVYLLDKNEQSLHIVRVLPYKDSLNQTQII